MATKKMYPYPLRDAEDQNKVVLIDLKDQVTVEQYHDLIRPIWCVRQFMIYHHKCSCPKRRLIYCDGHCEGCKYRVYDNEVISYDAPVNGQEETTIGDTLADQTSSIEDMMTSSEKFAEIAAMLDVDVQCLYDACQDDFMTPQMQEVCCGIKSLLSDEEGSIYEAWFELRNLREAAIRTNIPYTTYHTKLHKIFEKLRNKFSI